MEPRQSAMSNESKTETRNTKARRTAYQALPGYSKLDAWKRADDLAVELYFATKKLPRDDLWLRSQIMRAALSVPSNIVEGYARSFNREFLQFLNVAWSSLNEVEYQLHFISRTQAINDEAIVNPRQLARRSAQTLYALMRSVRGDDVDADPKLRRYLSEEGTEYYTRTEEQ